MENQLLNDLHLKTHPNAGKHKVSVKPFETPGWMMITRKAACNGRPTQAPAINGVGQNGSSTLPFWHNACGVEIRPWVFQNRNIF